MCGIAGIAGIKTQAQTEKCVLRMVREMDHRGPDAEGVWKGENVVLGHKRLSIIDLSSAANQPFIRQNHVLVFNGEIYNFLEIKSKLENKYSFKTNSDTEVVLYAYIEWKERCLDHFNGMFALAIWDMDAKELFFARDRLGIKPLYYSLSNDNLIFASEIRAVLASGLTGRKLNSDKIKDYLAYQTVHAPDTLVEDVFLLRPGEYAFFKGKELSINHYWRLDENAEPWDKSSYADIKWKVKDLFFKAVQRRLVSDVPLGVFLSGGIDSSAIVGAVSEVSDHKCATFSIGFSEAKYDESEYASLISRRFNTEHTKIELSSNELLRRLPEIINAYDHPSGDGPNSFLISKLVKEKGITVALSGLGGDELFAGYPSFKRMLKLNQFRSLWKLPRSLRLGLIKPFQPFMGDFRYQRLSEILGQDGSLESVFPINRRLLSNDRIEKLLYENTHFIP